MKISSKGRYAIDLMVDLAIYDKGEPISVRDIAEREQISGKYLEQIVSALGIASKPDSQDICFVPDGNYAGFILEHSQRENNPGNFVDMQGNVLGTHKGIVHYTIGQRKGLGIASGERLYVLDIRSDTNEVVLGTDSELMTKNILVRDFHCLSVPEVQDGMPVIAKIRYNHRGAKAVLRKRENGWIECVFEEPQRAPTPGQALVCYRDNYVVGGGTIVRR